jgi:Fe-S oxidoreductase
VDIATYRAEFLAHYYESKRRPLHAHFFGAIDRWAKLASIAPRTANFFSRAPGFSHLLRSLLNLPSERKLPRFAKYSFQSWVNARKSSATRDLRSETAAAANDRRVILWPDTFTNYFHPEAGRAALEVLEGAGFQVTVPQSHFCCGRPLYDFGMLDRAKEYLARIMQGLGTEIDAGVPIVVLEPSCASVFRDELRGLFPQDARAARLRDQTFLLSQFLRSRGYQPPQLHRKVLLHGHCHHKALMTLTDEEALLRSMGVELKSPDSGCCGMAGSFGFERDKYQISRAIGERVLLPAVREAAPETLIVSDGFSCREQIAQLAGRRAFHLAEILKLAATQSQLTT